MTPAFSSPSPALMAANRRLHHLREQIHTNRETDQADHEKPWFDESVSLPESGLVEGGGTAVILIAHLPDHLGWESAAATKSIRIAKQRHQQEQTRTKSSMADLRSFSSTSNGWEQQGQPLSISSKQQAYCQLHLPFTDESIKHYPSIGIAVLNEEQASIYRVWVMGRYLDEGGRGWLHVQNVREQLTGKESKLRLFTWRRLRQILGQGQSRFWKWDKGQSRLWLFGAARVAAHLDVERLVGKPVALSIKSVTKSIGDFKAHLYIGNKKNPEEAEKQAWQRGQATFEFVDYQGRQGRKGTTYIAWHLPNSYTGPHQQTSKGRMRKINRKLNVLVTKGAQGNGSETVEKMYHVNGAEAGRVLNRNQGAEAYWLIVNNSQRSNLWAIFSLV